MWVKLEDWAKENISWSMSRSQLRRLAATGRLHPATKLQEDGVVNMTQN